MTTPRPIYERIGDVLAGAAFTHAHYQTRWVNGMLVVAADLPLIYGKGGIHNWTEKQTKPDGWKRDLPRTLDVASDDPTRATAKFVVVLTTREPVSTGRDAYDGGTVITIKRLANDGSFDPDGEEIKYGRRNSYNYDVREGLEDPIERLYEMKGADLDRIHKASVLATLSPEQKMALGV
jgi:hypothetical protein